MTIFDDKPNVNADAEMLEAARSFTRRKYGATLADKATDTFCATLLQRDENSPGVLASAAAELSRRGTRVVMEALGRPVPLRAITGAPPMPSIVEFEAPHVPGQASAGAESRLTPHSDKPISRGDKAAERKIRIQEMKTASYQAVAGAFAEIDRSAGTALRLQPGAIGVPQIRTLITQFCWLNRTVRTWAGPAALTEVVYDDSVQRIDVPRPLVFEASVANYAAIGLPKFLESNDLTGQGVTVGIIDSEIASGHPALLGRVIPRGNYTSESWGNPGSHGTAVAGIIGSSDLHFPGIAPGVTIYNYKVVPTSNDDFDGAKAIEDAVDDGVDVINCSWGTGPISGAKSREALAVEAAWSALTTVVKSAGNRGPNSSTLTTPADADDVIVVGATDLQGKSVQRYSSRGPANALRRPDIVAPGGDGRTNIACCLVDGTFGDAGRGTSFAAPHVTGAIALLLEQKPGLDPDDLRDALVSSAVKLSAGSLDEQGHGLLQLV